MIQANELRVGNIVDNTYNNELVICEEILNNSVNYMDEYSVMHNFPVEELIGIPLTTEILEKCGFVKNRNGEPSIEINDIASHLELMEGKDNYYYPSFTQTPQGDEERSVYFNRINYLHQLQNLYFALTGKELNLNL